MRDPHVIDSRGGMDVPTRVITVHATGEIRGNIDDGRQYDMTLSSWAARYDTCRNGEWRRKRSIHGDSNGSIWGWLYSQCGDAGRVMLVARDCMRAMTMLGLWHELDTGQLSLMDADTILGHAANGRGVTAQPRPGYVCIEDTPTVIEVWRHQCQITICDLDNFASPRYPSGSTAQVECGRTWDTIRDIIDMWRRDVCARWSYTASGLSWQSWLAHGLPSLVHVHSDERVLALERQSLYGGICEARYIGQCQGKVIELDVRSMYPSVMRGMRAPVKLVSYHTELESLTPQTTPYEYICVADVTVSSEHVPYPVKIDGRTAFAVGKFRTTLCGAELMQAAATDHIRNVHSCAVYHVANIWDAWLARMTDIRSYAQSDGNVSTVSALKLAMNALWGKFASRSARWLYDPVDYAPTRWGQWTAFDDDMRTSRNYRTIAGVTWRECEPVEWTHSCPIIAAFVAAAARCRLRELIELAGRSHVYYVDTDSLLVDQCGYTLLADYSGLVGDEPGQLKVIGQWDDVEIFGPKHYRLDDRYICAGVIGSGDDVSLTRVRTAIASRGMSLICRGPTDKVKTWEILCQLDRGSSHGLIGEDGWVSPVRLST